MYRLGNLSREVRKPNPHDKLLLDDEHSDAQQGWSLETFSCLALNSSSCKRHVDSYRLPEARAGNVPGTVRE